LFWWHHEYKQKHPTTWVELKAAMRHRFVPSYYARNDEREVQGHCSKIYSNSFAGCGSTPSSASVYLAPSTSTPTPHERVESTAIQNHDAHHKQEDKDDMNEDEELTSSCSTSVPSFYNASYHPTENAGNVHGATLTEGENCVNMLIFSTNHTLVAQLIMEPSLDLSLSHGDLLDVSRDKDAWCANMLVLKINLLCMLLVKVMSSICRLLCIPWVTLNSLICVI
jgi:hypothetical protein